jgi:hypothetical protein
MSANFVDFPPRRKQRCSLQDIALLPQDFVLLARALRLGRNIGLPCITAITGPSIPVPSNPANQRRRADPKIFSHLALRPPARPNQANRFVLESPGKPSLLRHAAPLASSAALHFSGTGPK